MSFSSKLFVCVIPMLCLAACDSGGSSGIATDSFTEQLKAMVRAAPDDSEPVNVDQVMATLPDDTEPVTVD